MTHDLQNIKTIALIVRAETLDARLRREERAPLEAERLQYECIVAELGRRGERKVLAYYQGRLSSVYRPSSKYASSLRPQ